MCVYVCVCVHTCACAHTRAHVHCYLLIQNGPEKLRRHASTLIKAHIFHYHGFDSREEVGKPETCQVNPKLGTGEGHSSALEVVLVFLFLLFGI